MKGVWRGFYSEGAAADHQHAHPPSALFSFGALFSITSVTDTKTQIKQTYNSFQPKKQLS